MPRKAKPKAKATGTAKAEVDKKPPKPKTKPKAQVKLPDFSQFDQGGSSELGHARTTAIAAQIGRSWENASTALPLEVATTAEFRYVPWGIMMLDWLLNGVPLAHITRIWGPEGSFKTTLCWTVVRQFQNHCRHCKTPLVRHPECSCKNIESMRARHELMGDEVCPVVGSDSRCVDCLCPNPRWWLRSDEDYTWLPVKEALAISRGHLPEGTKVEKTDHPTLGRVPLPYLECEPPPAAFFGADGRPLKKKPKPRKVFFSPTNRCEPMRVAYVDAEARADKRWAARLGVDTQNVLLIGASWGEKTLGITEEAIEEREFDLIIIDSISMLETGDNLAKSLEDNARVASHANLMQRFVKRHVAECYREGLTARYRPTVIVTSQVRTHGIGSYHTWLGPTGGNALNHALILDIKMVKAGYEMDPSGQYPLKGKFDFEIKKCQAGMSPGGTGQVKFLVVEHEGQPVGDSDDLATVMSYARSLGQGFILDGKGKATLTLFSDYVQDGRRAFSRVGDCERFLRDNRTIYDDLRRRVLESLRRPAMGAGGAA